MIFRIIFDIFLVFAESRVLLRFRDKSIILKEFLLWTLLWMGAGAVINWPGIADEMALWLGINRGSDVIIYASIISILYLVFRIYVKMGYVERELTKLIREIALKEATRE